MSSKQFTAQIIDQVRREFAEQAAAAIGLPLAEVLESIIALHDRGHLVIARRDGGLTLVPCLDGKAINGEFDFARAHRNAGGRS